MKTLNISQIKEISAGYTPLTMDFYISSLSTDDELEQVAEIMFLSGFESYLHSGVPPLSYESCLCNLQHTRLECDLSGSVNIVSISLQDV